MTNDQPKELKGITVGLCYSNTKTKLKVKSYTIKLSVIWSTGLRNTAMYVSPLSSPALLSMLPSQDSDRFYMPSLLHDAFIASSRVSRQTFPISRLYTSSQEESLPAQKNRNHHSSKALSKKKKQKKIKNKKNFKKWLKVKSYTTLSSFLSYEVQKNWEIEI